MSIVIPPALADLQRTATAAFTRVPSEGWPQAIEAADALRDAVVASGLETDSYVFRRALHEAARGE
jgi:hypothetical protein